MEDGSSGRSPAKKVLLDVDPGIDDALAILLALASPEVDVRAITIASGNVPASQGTVNTLGLLEMAGRDIPVARGFEQPLIRPLVTAFETHGPAGIGHAVLPESMRRSEERHAVDRIVSEILANPGEITLVAVAPLTNVAVALKKEPRIATLLAELIVMGGALRVSGNVTPAAEFNFYVDPHAARIVLQSGAPVTLVPLDVTETAVLTAAHVETIGGRSSHVCRFVADSVRYYLEFHRNWDAVDGCFMHDPLALALAFAPELATYRPAFVDVETTGELTQGACVTDFGARRRGKVQNVRVVEEVNVPAFIELLLDRFR